MAHYDSTACGQTKPAKTTFLGLNTKFTNNKLLITTLPKANTGLCEKNIAKCADPNTDRLLRVTRPILCHTGSATGSACQLHFWGSRDISPILACRTPPNARDAARMLAWLRREARPSAWPSEFRPWRTRRRSGVRRIARAEPSLNHGGPGAVRPCRPRGRAAAPGYARRLAKRRRRMEGEHHRRGHAIVRDRAGPAEAPSTRLRPPRRPAAPVLRFCCDAWRPRVWLLRRPQPVVDSDHAAWAGSTEGVEHLRHASGGPGSRLGGPRAGPRNRSAGGGVGAAALSPVHNANQPPATQDCRLAAGKELHMRR